MGAKKKALPIRKRMAKMGLSMKAIIPQKVEEIKYSNETIPDAKGLVSLYILSKNQADKYINKDESLIERASMLITKN